MNFVQFCKLAHENIPHSTATLVIRTPLELEAFTMMVGEAACGGYAKNMHARLHFDRQTMLFQKPVDVFLRPRKPGDGALLVEFVAMYDGVPVLSKRIPLAPDRDQFLHGSEWE